MHCVEPGHSFVDAMADDAGTSAQRIRIGLTGLAFAFLLVLLASIISRSGDDEPAIGAEDTASANEAEPSEPLADLGVAPGAGGDANNSSSNRP